MLKRLKKDIQLLNRKINDLEALNYFSSMKIDDIYSLNLLDSLITGYPFLPFTGSAMRPFCINHILNDININQRSHIIEFGAGISSILIARLIKKNNLAVNHTAIDHNEKWLETLKTLLHREHLEDQIRLIHAPLANCEFSVENNQWFDSTILNNIIDEEKFDMVVIDGPPAWKEGNEKIRYPAMPFMFKRLEENFSIYLDDASRSGEKSVIALWEKEYNIKFNITGESLAFYYSGENFYTEPSGYFRNESSTKEKINN